MSSRVEWARRARWVLGAALWSTVLSLVSACAPIGDRAPDLAAEEAALRARVMARWEAVRAEDFEAAWAFGSAEYREETSVDQVRARYTNRARLEEVRITEVFFSVGDVSQASVNLLQRFEAGGTKASNDWEPIAGSNEVWVKREGQWWFVRNR